MQERIHDLGGAAFDVVELGYFLVVESGDTVGTITAQLGYDILCNRFTGIRYEQTRFTPSFEFVKKADGVSLDLLAMCQRHAVQRAT